MATAIQESKLRNINYGDRDSLGLFQQRPSQGLGHRRPRSPTRLRQRKFYDALVKVDGYETMDITKVAQKVQRSAFPDAYADHEQEGRVLASALSGHSPGGLGCRLPKPSRGRHAAPRSSRSSRPSRDDRPRLRADGDAAGELRALGGRRLGRGQRGAPRHAAPSPWATVPWSRSRDESAWTWDRARSPVAATSVVLRLA